MRPDDEGDRRRRRSVGVRHHRDPGRSVRSGGVEPEDGILEVDGAPLGETERRRSSSGRASRSPSRRSRPWSAGHRAGRRRAGGQIAAARRESEPAALVQSTSCPVTVNSMPGTSTLTSSPCRDRRRSRRPVPAAPCRGRRDAGRHRPWHGRSVRSSTCSSIARRAASSRRAPAPTFVRRPWRGWSRPQEQPVGRVAHARRGRPRGCRRLRADRQQPTRRPSSSEAHQEAAPSASPVAGESVGQRRRRRHRRRRATVRTPRHEPRRHGPAGRGRPRPRRRRRAIRGSRRARARSAHRSSARRGGCDAGPVGSLRRRRQHDDGGRHRVGDAVRAGVEGVAVRRAPRPPQRGGPRQQAWLRRGTARRVSPRTHLYPGSLQPRTIRPHILGGRNRPADQGYQASAGCLTRVGPAPRPRRPPGRPEPAGPPSPGGQRTAPRR